MISCWKQNPAERPLFDYIYTPLKRESCFLLDSLGPAKGFGADITKIQKGF
jgi:hypothetical protein